MTNSNSNALLQKALQEPQMSFALLLLKQTCCGGHEYEMNIVVKNKLVWLNDASVDLLVKYVLNGDGGVKYENDYSVCVIHPVTFQQLLCDPNKPNDWLCGAFNNECELNSSGFSSKDECMDSIGIECPDVILGYDHYDRKVKVLHDSIGQILSKRDLVILDW